MSRQVNYWEISRKLINKPHYSYPLIDLQIYLLYLCSSVSPIVSTDMASSSTLSLPTITNRQGVYGVFISFRGKDTRNNFTSHLHAALRQKQILSFTDSKHLRAGDQISDSLFKAIEGSKLCLIIFSPNYASSKWCLLELERILECKKTRGKIVIPVFYKVDPSHVRYQTEGFGDAFRKHEVREKMDRVQRWRATLNEAASLSGWDSFGTRHESGLIENIVGDILDKLNQLSSTYSKGLVGIDSHVEKLKSLLHMESPISDVCSVGIWGMGGIGKTTIAQAFFDSVYSLFSGHHIFTNVREELARHGPVAFWNKFLQEILDEKDVIKGTPSLRFSFIRERLRCKRVVIVFDDVDDSVFMQLPDLAAHRDLFGPGSKIVMTSRDKKVLENLSIDPKKVYKVEGLKRDEAMQLFSLNAFKDKCSPLDHKELLQRVIDYTEGNPLALKILGSALSGRNRKYWECALDKIEKFPKERIIAILRVSYDGLSVNEKNIFLDIACFFIGEPHYHAIEILDHFRDLVYCSVINLIDKCLVTISHNNELEMHHLLREMGWAIVREESVNPENRSRLHDAEEICHVLTKKKGTEAIQSINLDLSQAKEMHIECDAFVGMDNLRLLKIIGWNPKVHILSDGLQLLFDKLRYLYWEAFPLKSLPSSFYVGNLVKCDLQNGKFKHLWTGAQHLMNLKWVDLSLCQYLTEIPDLSNAKNIETIDLYGCWSLVTLHSSVQQLDKLASLNLRNCKKLRNLPIRLDSKFLRVFDLGNCSAVQNCPEIVSGNLGVLDLFGTRIKEPPQLVHDFKFLEILRISNFPSMTKFPEISSNMVDLTLRGTAIEQVPSPIQCLTRLSTLDLSNNKNLSILPITFSNIKFLRQLYLSNCPKLEYLPDILEPVEGLAYLDLSGCYNLKRLPYTISSLKSLEFLVINNCKLIRFIPTLPESVHYLVANNCASLETLSSSSNCQFLFSQFTNCSKMDKETRQKIIAHAQSSIQLNIGQSTTILPGSEIPQWFRHQSVGSSITMQLPSNFNYLVGIAFCVVYHFISPRQQYRRISVSLESKAKFTTVDATLWLPGTNTKSDHVLLHNFQGSHLKSFNLTVASETFLNKNYEASFKFRPVPADNCVVKKCGVYFNFADNSSSNGQECCIGSGEEGCLKSMRENANIEGRCNAVMRKKRESMTKDAKVSRL